MHMVWRWIALGAVGLFPCETVHAEGPAWPAIPISTIACRGCEHSGRFVEDNPGWGPHLVTLFCAAKDPDSPWHTAQQHLDWAAAPLHSYVADGHGCPVVWAHPSYRQYDDIVGLRGLAGIEVSHGGDAGSRERLWDRVLTYHLGRGQPAVWGFAADDTHSIKDIDKSWFAARLARLTEHDLKHALRTGGFYVSNGPSIVDIQVEGSAITVKLAEPGDIRWLKGGQFGTGPATVDAEPGQDHCLQFDKAATASTYTLSEADGTTDPRALFVRCIVTTAIKGQAAFTQPFAIRSAASVDNPYASTGRWYKGQTHNHSDIREGGEERVREYYAAYATKGHACAFETGYDYWVMPFLHYPSSRTPVIDRAEPARVAKGHEGKITLHGRGFAPKAVLVLDGQPINAHRGGDDRLTFTLPADTEVGRHTLTVRNPDGLQDTRQYALTVQASSTANAGWTTFTPDNSKLGSRYAYCVAADPAGGVWIGTNNGLNHFDGRAWKVFRRGGGSEAILANTVYDLAVDADGTAWYTCFSGVGMIRSNGAGKQWRSPDIGIPRYQVNQILRWGDATYVTPHNARGLHRYKAGKWEKVAGAEAKSDNDRMTGMAVDKQGRFWLGSGGGLLCWDTQKEEDAWKQYTAANSGLPDNRVMRLAFDRKGRLWMGTATPSEQAVGGLCCFDGDEWASFTPANSPLPERRIWSVFVDRDDNVWAGTSKGAVCRRADGTWQVFTACNSGLADDFVTDIGQDSQGDLWFTTANGVSRLSHAPASQPITRPG
jgi:sugar lactone lactonase YvrE